MLHGCICEHEVGPGPGQIAHTHRRDAEWQVKRLTQNSFSQVSVFNIDQNTRLQTTGIEDCLVMSIQSFATGRAIDIVEYHTGETSAGSLARILNV